MNDGNSNDEGMKGTAGEAERLRRGLRRRRRSNIDGGRKAAVVKVSVDEAELAKLRFRSEVSGVSVPRLLVESALADQSSPTQEERDALHDVVTHLLGMKRLVAGVAVNANQLAAKANATDTFPEEARALKTDALRVMGDIQGVLAEVGRRLRL